MDFEESPTDQQWQDMLLNHIILPRILPQSKSRHFHQTELNILDEMVKCVEMLSEHIPSETVRLFRRMKNVHFNLSPNNVANEINGLRTGDSFAMFVRRQNCTFMIHAPKDNNQINQVPHTVIVATFPGNLHPNEVYEHDSDIEVNY